jgi:hypothetical protein
MGEEGKQPILKQNKTKYCTGFGHISNSADKVRVQARIAASSLSGKESDA